MAEAAAVPGTKRAGEAAAARQVAIIGAGVAGLACARALQAAGDATVRVFDKARGPGGRVSTRRAGHLAFDHGAQYFTCRTPAFRAQLDDWLERDVAAPWAGRVVAIEHGALREDPGEDVRYVGTPRMSALGRDLARGLDVALERHVAALELDRGAAGPRWTVRMEDGTEEGPFDLAVVATPAPQAAPLLGESPELAARVGSIEMQPGHAAMVAFDRDLDAPFDAAFVRGSPLAWIARNGSKPGRADASTWVLQTTVDWSEAHLDDDGDALGPPLLEAFTKASGVALPPPSHLAVHRWLYARSEQPLGEPFVWEPARRLGVCGDWMIGGRVEGAFSSGAQLGEAIARA